MVFIGWGSKSPLGKRYMLKQVTSILSVVGLLLLLNGSVFGQCSADAGTDTSICQGGSVQIGGAVSGTGTGSLIYTWSPATGLSCTNCPNPIASPNSNQTYTLTVTDQNNCQANSSVTITTFPAPNSNFTFSGNNNCSNIPVQFTDASTGTQLSYQWDFGDPASGVNNTSTIQNPNHAFQFFGTGTQNFTVTLTVTSPGGCSSSSQQTVTVQASPGPALIDPIDNFQNCDGSNFSLTVYDATAGNSNTNHTIIWGDGSPNYSAPVFPGGGVNHLYTSQNVFNLQYIVTGSNGCTDTTEYNVANITNPAIGAANPGGTTGCGPLNLCFPLNNYQSNHNTTYYVVDYGDGSPLDTFPHPPPNTVCHTYDSTSCGQPNNQYEFNITAINLCDNSTATIAPIRVFIEAEPDFEMDTACANQPVTFVNNTQTGFNSSCSNATVFTWDFGDGNTQTTTSSGNVQHVYSNPGAYQVVLTAANSCAAVSDTQSICVEAPPVPSFTASSTANCVPFTTVLVNTSNTANSCNTTQLWTVLFNGSPCQPSSGSYQYVGGTDANSTNPQIQFLDPGNYTIRLTLTNRCGSFDEEVDILAQAPPQAAITPPNDICIGDSINPSATVLDCLEPIDTYAWSFTGGSPNSSNNADPGFIVYPVAGTFPIQLTVTNACGSTTANSSINVNPAPGNLNPSVASPICENDTADFTSSLQTGTYNWTGPNGFTSSQQNFSINGLSSSDAGWYYLYGSSGSCIGPIDSVELVVTPAPVISVTPTTATFCDGDSVTITASGATNYLWTPADSLSASTGSTVIAFPSVSTVYTVYGDNGTCAGTATTNVTVNPKPSINLGGDTTVCNQPVSFQLNGSPSGGTWSGQHVNNNGTFTPNGVGSFNLSYTYTDGNGCTDSNFRLIDVVDPTPSDAGPDSVACLNDPSVQLTGLPNNGTWSGPNVSNSGLFDPISSGNFELIYAIGSGSCLTRDTMNFLVNPLPVVTAGNDTTVCFDEPAFTLNGSPNGSTWTGNGVTSPTGTFDPAVSDTGTHVVTLSFTEPSTGCLNTDSLVVQVNGLPDVEAGPDTSICNQPIPVQLIGLPGGGTWSGPNINANGEFLPTTNGNFTVFYQVIAGSNCSNIDSMVVTVIDATPSNAGPDLEACLFDDSTQLIGSPASGTWSGTIVSSDGWVNPNQAGNFDLIISNGTGNCLTSDTMVFTVHDLPPVAVGPDQDFCANDAPVNFTATAPNGTWTGNGITDQFNGTFDPTVPGVGVHTITYTIIDLVTTCENSDSLLANVQSLPIADFDYDTLTCVQVSEAYTNLSTNAVNYFWDFDDGFTTSLISPQHAYVNPGFYDIELIAETTAGCRDTIVQEVEVRLPPVADFTLTPDSACAPVDVSFTNHSVGVDLSYFWIFGNGNTSSDEQPANETFHQGHEDDSLYTVYLEVTNFCGVQFDSATVRAMPTPTAIFAPESDVTCDQFNLEIVNNSVGFPDNFHWDFGDGATSTTSDSILTHPFAGNDPEDTNYTIQLIAYNECGSDTAYHTIYIYPNTVNAFFNTDVNEGCSPLTVNFGNFSQGETFTSWDFGDGNLSGDYSTSHTFQNPGTYTVSLFATNGCDVDTAFATILVHPDPNIDFESAPDSVCINEDFQFTNLSTNASSFVWDFGDGDSSSLTHPTHSYDSVGTYDVTLTGLSLLYNCTFSTTKQVTLKNGPTAAFDMVPPFGCIPLTVDFSNQSENELFIAWDFDNGNSSIFQTPSQTFTDPGDYNVKLVVESQNGCRDSVVQLVTAYPLPSVSFIPDPEDPCVLPMTVDFLNTSVDAVSYEWDFDDGSVSSAATHPTHVYQSEGPFDVTLIGTSINGCQDTAIEVVQRFTPATGFVDFDIDTICTGEPIVFSATTTNSDSLLWDFGNGTFSAENPATHTYLTGGTYEVNLISFGESGCNDTTTASVPMIVYEEPTADFFYDDVLAGGTLNGTIQFTNTSIHANSYFWEFGDGQTSSEENPSTKYNTSGPFDMLLVAFGEHDCIDSLYDVIDVTLYKGLFIPNAINPGNPVYELGHFVPKGVGMREFELLIYDDWGNLIWSTNSLDENGRPTEAWDGYHKGELVQQDAYVWKARAVFRDGSIWEGKLYDNGKYKKAGTITVVH